MVLYYREIGMMVCSIINGIYNCNMTRNNNNDPLYDDPSPCTPQEFVHMKSSAFSRLMDTQRSRLESSLGNQEIALIEDEFELLRQCYRSANELPLKAAIDALGPGSSFKVSWSLPLLAKRFNSLLNFAGGLASPFPNTATVESDFSVLKCEKNNSRTDLEDLSLEGILQCKEHEKLKALCVVKRN